MNEPTPIATRLKRLIDEAKSQKKVARLAGVSDGTLINWIRGLGLRESKLRDAAHNLGVSLEWLRDGLGDEEAELASFRARLSPDQGARRTLRVARERAGLSLAALAKRTGYPVIILELLENGTIRASERLIEALCRELPTLRKEDLMDDSDHPLIVDDTGIQVTTARPPAKKAPSGMTGRYVPLVSLAEAGPWDVERTEALYDCAAIFALNITDRRAFAIKISGNSMEPVLHDGDLVICSPDQALHNGDAAVVRTHSEQVFTKYWEQQGDRVILSSANENYAPLEFPATEIVGAWAVVQRISSGKIKRRS